MKSLAGILLVVAAGGAWPSLGLAAERLYDVRNYGAAPGGETLCTAAIQKAVDQCAAGGGGTVYFPPGAWLSGTIELRSQVTLQLDAGCRLLASSNSADYPDAVLDARSHKKSSTARALLRGQDIEHVTIRGQGTIDGRGANAHWKEDKQPTMVIRLVRCRDVLVEDVSLCNSPTWMQLHRACERVRIHGITVNNHVHHGNDGLDVDDCRDVRVSDCRIDSDDDAICLKSTSRRPCENVTISNCVVSSDSNAIKAGTDSKGGFRNITIANCTISSPVGTKAFGTVPTALRAIGGRERGLAGVALELVDGGTLENIAVTNLAIDGVITPIFLRLSNRGWPVRKDMPRAGVGSFRNVVLSNIVATHAWKVGCSISGIAGHPIENVQLSNIQITFDGGGTRSESHVAVREMEESYPECTKFGVLPAYVFFCRHVAGLKLCDVRLRTATPDRRHAVICEDVKGLVLDGLDVWPAGGAAAAIRLLQCPGAQIRNSGGIPTDMREAGKSEDYPGPRWSNTAPAK